MKAVDLDDARLRRAWTALSDTAVPSGRCPAPERLWAVARGELDADETRTVASHMALCGACAEAWRLARELEVVVPGPSLTVDVRRAPVGPWSRWGRLAAAAAAVVLAATAVLHVPAGSVYRGEPAGAPRSLLPEGRSLPRAAFVLRWSRGPAGTRYDVQVATQGLTVVARARGLEASSYQVPEPALRSLPAGTPLAWQVEARLPDGGRVASGTFLTRVR